MSDGSPVRTYFLGSGRLGIPMVDALLLDPRISLLGIGSQCDKPYGRKKVITPTQLCQHVMNRGLDVDRVSSVNSDDFLAKLRSLNLDLLVVVAFGQLLRPTLLGLPEFGCLNVHASLLPKYRGACPIASALLNGDTETGVCFMKMDKGLDTGPVYSLLRTRIDPLENAGQLEERLGRLAKPKKSGMCAIRSVGRSLNLCHRLPAMKAKSVKSARMMELWTGEKARCIFPGWCAHTRHGPECTLSS